MTHVGLIIRDINYFSVQIRKTGFALVQFISIGIMGYKQNQISFFKRNAHRAGNHFIG